LLKTHWLQNRTFFVGGVNAACDSGSKPNGACPIIKPSDAGNVLMQRPILENIFWRENVAKWKGLLCMVLMRLFHQLKAKKDKKIRFFDVKVALTRFFGVK
jgi:hypothetical protein